MIDVTILNRLQANDPTLSAIDLSKDLNTELDNNDLKLLGQALQNNTHLKEITIRYQHGVTDLSFLEGRVPQLEKLDLSCTDIDENSLKQIRHLTNLKELSLSSTNITNVSGLSVFKNMEKLDLYGLRITDLSPLSALSNLRSLLLFFAPGHTKINLLPIGRLTQLTRLEFDPLAYYEMPNRGLAQQKIIYNALIARNSALAAENDVFKKIKIYNSYADVLKVEKILSVPSLFNIAASFVNSQTQIPTESKLNIDVQSRLQFFNTDRVIEDQMQYEIEFRK